MWPAPLTPGRDWVRAMGGPRPLAADRERECPPPNDKGEAFRARKGSWLGTHEGEVGDVGEGSVDRRRVGGFRRLFGSGGARVEVETLWSRRLGRGDERNSSILSVSGTDSIVTVGSVVLRGYCRCGASGKPTGHLDNVFM